MLSFNKRTAYSYSLRQFDRSFYGLQKSLPCDVNDSHWFMGDCTITMCPKHKSNFEHCNTFYIILHLRWTFIAHTYATFSQMQLATFGFGACATFYILYYAPMNSIILFWFIHLHFSLHIWFFPRWYEFVIKTNCATMHKSTTRMRAGNELKQKRANSKRRQQNGCVNIRQPDVIAYIYLLNLHE